MSTVAGQRPDVRLEDGVDLGLAVGTVRFREVLFQSITAMAPAGATAMSVAVGANYAGGSLTLAVLVALLPCLATAVSIGQLAKHLPSAGSIYTYPARALHPSVGFLVGWGYVLASAAWCPAIALMASVQIAGVVTSGSGAGFTATWTAIFLAATVIILVLGYRGVQLSARTGTVLGALEIAVFVVLAVWLIATAGRANTAAPFGVGLATVKGYEGWTGIVAAAVFTAQAFVGFESAAPLAEEAMDSRRTIALATIGSCAGIGAFYVLTTYAATVAYGPARFQEFAAMLDRGSPWFGLARAAWGSAWVLVFLTVLNSYFGGQNAFFTAGTRTIFALARIRLLPSALARTHPRFRSPHAAALVQFAFAILIGIGAGWLFGPVPGSLLLATMCTAVPIGVYILINAACCVYYLRERPSEFHWLLHGLIPVVGGLVLIPVLMAALGIGSAVLPFVAPLPYPIRLTGPLIAGWYVAGVVYLAWVAVRFPDRLLDTARIFDGR